MTAAVSHQFFVRWVFFSKRFCVWLDICYQFVLCFKLANDLTIDPNYFTCQKSKQVFPTDKLAMTYFFSFCWRSICGCRTPRRKSIKYICIQTYTDKYNTVQQLCQMFFYTNIVLVPWPNCSWILAQKCFGRLRLSRSGSMGFAVSTLKKFTWK